MVRVSNNTTATSFCDRPATPHEYDLREFFIDRQARNLAPSTFVWYSRSLTIWLTYAGVQEIQETEQITPSHLRHFLLDLSQHHNEGGVANIFGALKAFLNWHEDETAGPNWQNPLRKVKNPRRSQEPLEPLPLAHFRALLAQCPAKTLAGDRDKAVFLFLLDSGVRQQELTDLNVGDVDMNTGAVLVRSGKGRKPRVVFIGAKTRRALIACFRHRGRLDDEDPLWVHVDNGTKLTKAGIRQIVRRRAAEAGIRAPGLHAFRRAFAVNSLRNGMDVVSLQRLLGHTSFAVINRYLKLVTEDLHRVHARHGAVDNLD